MNNLELALFEKEKKDNENKKIYRISSFSKNFRNIMSFFVKKSNKTDKKQIESRKKLLQKKRNRSRDHKMEKEKTKKISKNKKIQENIAIYAEKHFIEENYHIEKKGYLNNFKRSKQGKQSPNKKKNIKNDSKKKINVNKMNDKTKKESLRKKTKTSSNYIKKQNSIKNESPLCLNPIFYNPVKNLQYIKKCIQMKILSEFMIFETYISSFIGRSSNLLNNIRSNFQSKSNYKLFTDYKVEIEREINMIFQDEERNNLIKFRNFFLTKKYSHILEFSNIHNTSNLINILATPVEISENLIDEKKKSQCIKFKTIVHLDEDKYFIDDQENDFSNINEDKNYQISNKNLFSFDIVGFDEKFSENKTNENDTSLKLLNISENKTIKQKFIIKSKINEDKKNPNDSLVTKSENENNEDNQDSEDEKEKSVNKQYHTKMGHISTFSSNKDLKIELSDIAVEKKNESNLNLDNLISIYSQSEKDKAEILKKFKGVSFEEKVNLENKLEFNILRDKKEGYIKYIGETKNGNLHGRGIYFHPNGQIKYKGYFSDNKFNGMGMYIGDDGYSLYIGFYKNDMSNGVGVCLLNTYDDQTPQNSMDDEEKTIQSCDLNEKYNKQNKKGMFQFLFSLALVVNYENDVENGKGIKLFPDKTLKEGTFKNSFLNGFGTLYNNKGLIEYQGSFINDKFNGLGIFHVNEDLNNYIGKFKNNEYHGYGIFLDQNMMCIHKGEYFNGKACGYGKWFDVNDGRCIYEGYFKDGFYDGVGISYENEYELKYGKYKNGIAPWKFKHFNKEDKNLIYEEMLKKYKIDIKIKEEEMNKEIIKSENFIDKVLEKIKKNK